ncbi:MAG: flagellar hook-length control protein FliK [Burkholderiales bacterium]|nr:flagellar hook-length control protein FliK [Phycisphaerae bacterium]
MGHHVELTQLSRKGVMPPKRQNSPEKPSASFDQVLNRRASRRERAPETRQNEPRTNESRTNEPDAKQSEPERKVDKKSRASATKRGEKQPSEPTDDASNTESSEPASEPSELVKSSSTADELTDKAAAHAVADSGEIEPVATPLEATLDPIRSEQPIQPEIAQAIAAIPQAVPADAVAVESSTEAPTEAHDSASQIGIPGANVIQQPPAGTSASIAVKPGTEIASDADAGPIALPVEAALMPEGDASGEESPQQNPNSSTSIEAQFAPSAGTANLPAESESDDFADQLAAMTTPAKPPATAPVTATTHAQPPVAPERHFAEKNVDQIVTVVKGELSPTGGSMKIRLDPPHLGELNVDVSVDRDGMMSATFQTTNSEATRLLSHSLQDLRGALESTGVVIDRIQVRQASPSEQASSQNRDEREGNQQQNPHDHPARQEQQRREILERMWRKLSLGEEPLDLVA